MTETPDQSPKTAETTAKAQLPTGPGASFTFIYYFSTAALITAFFTVKTLGVGLNTGLPGQLALVGGSIGGLMGVFFNRTQTLEVPLTSRKAFTRQLATVLTEMGYTLTATVDGIERYQRSPLQRLFAGDIFVQIQDQQAVFVSRAANIRRLRRHLGAS